MSVVTSSTNIQLTLAKPIGFTLPAGYQWEPKLVKGKKEGPVTVYTDEGLLYAQLVFHVDKLNGVCSFYEEGSLKEKINYENNVMNGWSHFYDHGKEITSFLYENGVKKKKLEKYGVCWKEVDLTNEKNFMTCVMDEDKRKQGVCYRYENEELVEELEYKDDELVRRRKTFTGKEVTELGENGEKVYQGCYLLDEKGYRRNGKGKEFEGSVVSYLGEWRDDKKEGEGKSLRNGVVYYEGKWKENVPDGEGVLHNEDGSVFVSGKWSKGFIEMGKNVYDYMSESIESGVPGAEWMWSELIVGVVYLVVGLLMGLEVGKVSIPFVRTGCAFLLVAYLQQFGNIIMRIITLILSFVSIGLIAVWINMYANWGYYWLYWYGYKWYDCWRYGNDYYSIKSYINSNILRVLVYFLFTGCTLYLPVSSVMVFNRSIKNKSPIQMNAFSITRQVKGRWCILIEIALGFGFMISSCIMDYFDLYNYKPSDLKEHGITNLHLFLLIPFIYALVYFVIVYLQINVKRRKMGCIIGMVWGVVSCILSIVLAVGVHSTRHLYHYDSFDLFVYFIVIACITWLILPLSIIILRSNKSSKKTLPITTVPSSKV